METVTEGILTIFGTPSSTGAPTTAGRQQLQGSQKQQGRQQQYGLPESLETLSVVRTSTAVGMVVTAETFATAGTPGTSTAVKTTAAAGAPATVETITTVDVANIMAEDSFLFFFTSLLFFLHPFPGFYCIFICRLFTPPSLSFTSLPSFFYLLAVITHLLPLPVFVLPFACLFTFPLPIFLRQYSFLPPFLHLLVCLFVPRCRLFYGPFSVFLHSFACMSPLLSSHFLAFFFHPLFCHFTSPTLFYPFLSFY